MIIAEGLSKFYGDFEAIKDVNFHIKEGEVVGLLGLNGAGKSTILKILGTFLLPSEGSASIAGYSVFEDPDLVRQNIGYLPDTPPLYNEMKVRSFLDFVYQLKSGDKKNLKSAVDLAIEKTSLQSVVNERMGSLSHGFRQRVGIASAIVHNPKVLILDEPINGLDPVQIVEMRDLIISLKGQHTLILSSHILSEITKTCDQIFIIDQGRLVASGGESDLLKQMSEQMSLTCELSAVPNNLLASLESISGVESLLVEPNGAGTSVITLVTNTDIRGQVARMIVESNVDLLSFNKKEAGLESLFLKLVNSPKEN